MQMYGNFGGFPLPIPLPIGSMYGIFTYIYHRFMPNVGKYTCPMDPMGHNSA